MKPQAFLFLLWAVAASGAEEITIDTQRRDSAVEVRASARVAARYDMVWRTLTDYDHLADFVPGMRTSRVLERRGNTWVVEQRGETRFLFLSYPVDVTVLATAHPPGALEVRLLRGNLRRLEGGYRVEPLADGTVRLRWNGLIEPESLPPLLGEMMMRATIRDQFTGMVREIERREAERRAPR